MGCCCWTAGGSGEGVGGSGGAGGGSGGAGGGSGGAGGGRGDVSGAGATWNPVTAAGAPPANGAAVKNGAGDVC
jgi:hypothetical protein